jgi:nucleoside-diphosphate-sugar epimerase
MHAFVTGATGFAGGYLCEALVRQHHTVTALARPTSNTKSLENLGIRVVEGDIRHKESFSSALSGVDTFFHLAAVFREAGASEHHYRDVNVEGTRNAVEAAAEAGVGRFVHCSTIGVIGDTGSRPADEARPFCEPRDSYNRTKIEGEKIARQLFEELGLPGTVVRPSAGYGPGELRYVKLFKAIKRGRFVMIGSGKTLYNLAYIDDLCNGIILSGVRPEAVGQIYILAGAENVTLEDLVARIASIVDGKAGKAFSIPLWPIMTAAVACESLCRPLGIEPPLHRRRVEFFTVNRAFDISRARAQLGYDPGVALDEGLRRTASWYESQGLL